MTHSTNIGDLGEFGLIHRINSLLSFRLDDPSIHDNLIMGISDDAAVYRPTPGKVQLLTTDALVEGVHFDLTFTSFRHLGWKAMVASISDIAAMGGTPRYALITLSLPPKITVEMVDELYAGAAMACRKYRCLVVGGDTTSSAANMTVSVTLTGESDEGAVRYRTGARPGQYLCVTGHLGASLAGLKILQREKQRYQQAGSPADFRPTLEPYAPAIERHLMPVARLDAARLLTSTVAVGALIDISDGLASEVHHICAGSRVGATVYEHNVPVHGTTQKIAQEFHESPVEYALYGGEDYELLFTVGEDDFRKLEPLTDDITIVGRVTEELKGIELVREQGEHEELKARGWDHFRR